MQKLILACGFLVIFVVISSMMYHQNGKRYKGNNLEKMLLTWSPFQFATDNRSLQHNATESMVGPKKHFIFTKIEKTGSTTLSIIFARFVLKHNLNIASQVRDFHINWRNHRTWRLGPRRDELADVLFNHAQFNQTAFDKYFVKDTIYMASFRDPESWIKSAVKFFHKVRLESEGDPEKVIMNDKLLERKRISLMNVQNWYILPQLQWLGFDINYRYNVSYIELFIEKVVERIDLPLLNEQFDAGIIMIRRRMHWDYTDLFYTSYEVTHSESANVSDEARAKLLSPRYNLGEKLLYEAMNKSWWSQPEVNEPDFWEEVDYYRKVNKQITSLCKNMPELPSNIATIMDASKWHDKLHITKELCNLLKMPIGLWLPKMISYTAG